MRAKRLVSVSIVVMVLAIGSIFALMQASLPTEDGEITLPGLMMEVKVNSDTLGIPSIIANGRRDAFRTLGFFHARDRLFQMELMRRKSAGTLAELFGISAVKLDRKQRTYQFSKTARNIIRDLPTEQRQVLSAYAEGVNSYIERTHILSPEFLMLQHHPKPWTEEDSILVILAMFQTLNGQEQDERMVTVMEQALPDDLVKFLTPDSDIFSTVLVGGNAPRRFSKTISAHVFATLPETDAYLAHNSVDAENIVAGSNNWVVAGSKTIDGRAIVANDMHLGLSIPNIWYRASLRYQDRHIYGVTLPGVPSIVVGANDDVAWGFTNVTGDLIDLIRLDINPDNPQQYRTAQGWKKFETHNETLHVKNAPDIQLTLQDTIWGPVSEQLLLNHLVAVKWTALERHGVDLGLLAMDQARSTQQAMTMMNHIGAPPQNVVIADREGHIGWTYMGRFPRRLGFDGLASRSWADRQLSWQGFIPAKALPRLFDPPNGFIVTANNRTLGRDYPYTIGHNWSLGYRAFRIAELLRDKENLTERDLLAIQLDTRSGVYDFYRQLALEELAEIKNQDAILHDIEQALQAWDGHMHNDSIGAAYLIEFRKQLAKEVFAKVVAACQKYDPDFRYAWREMETPLRLLLTQRPQGLLRTRYHDNWRQMIVKTLHQTAGELHKRYPAIDLTQTTWGETHLVTARHPFSKVSPLLGKLLDMPTFGSDGCASVCVKVMSSRHSASERLVLSPLHPENAIFHMPGGQSGHPLSRHYHDQHYFWQNGIASPMQSNTISHTLHFVPQKS